MRLRCSVPALLLLLSTTVQAQVHKDTRLGFQFKPPAKFDAVALTPSEARVVAKYQSDAREHGSSWERQANPIFEVMFYPASVAGEDREAFVDGLWEEAQGSAGFTEMTKRKAIRIEKVECFEAHLVPENGAEAAYVAILDQPDGVFLFQGRVIKERLDKYAGEYSKAARSFKRIDKDDRSAADAELAQMSDQDRFLQEQINRLPPGWHHHRTARYLFLSNADKDWVKQLGQQIEAIREVYETIYPPTTPITAVSIVRVCGSRDDYFGYGGPQGTGGYWNSAERELVCFDNPPRVETEAVLNHEAFHQYIYYFYGELSPHSWYNEGTGDYFAGAKMTKTFRVQGFGAAPGGYDRTGPAKEACRLLSEGRTKDPAVATPLKDLMRYSQGEYYARGGVHYPQGWALIHMLRESKRLKPKWAEILDDYLEALLAARHEVAIKTMERAVEQAEKKEAGSSVELPTDPKEWYAKADTGEIQDLAYEKTFVDWSQSDWDEFNAFYLEYVEKL